MEKIEAIELSALKLLQQNLSDAKTIINEEYPFQKIN